MSYACGVTYRFQPGSADLVWSRTTGCSGGGGKTPVLANGKLYVRDLSFPAVLDAATGAVVGTQTGFGPPPAVDATRAYMLSYPTTSSTVTATNLSSTAITWEFAGDGGLSTAPLVAGDTVLVGSGSGRLYGLSAASGAVTWSVDVGSAIPGPDEWNVSQPLTGLATSGGLVVVPAGSQLVAYR